MALRNFLQPVESTLTCMTGLRCKSAGITVKHRRARKNKLRQLFTSLMCPLANLGKVCKRRNGSSFINAHWNVNARQCEVDAKAMSRRELQQLRLRCHHHGVTQWRGFASIRSPFARNNRSKRAFLRRYKIRCLSPNDFLKIYLFRILESLPILRIFFIRINQAKPWRSFSVMQCGLQFLQLVRWKEFHWFVVTASCWYRGMLFFAGPVSEKKIWLDCVGGCWSKRTVEVGTLRKVETKQKDRTTSRRDARFAICICNPVASMIQKVRFLDTYANDERQASNKKLVVLRQ